MLKISKTDVEVVKEKKILNKYRDYIHRLESKLNRYDQVYIDDKQNISYIYAYYELKKNLEDRGLEMIKKLKKEPYRFTLKKLNLIYYKITKSFLGFTYLWFLFNNLIPEEDEFNGWWKLTDENISTFRQSDRIVKFYDLKYNEIDRLRCYLNYEMMNNLNIKDVYHRLGSIKNILKKYLWDYRRDLKVDKEKYADMTLLQLIKKNIIYKTKKNNKVYYVLKSIYDIERQIEDNILNLIEKGISLEDNFVIDESCKPLPDKDQVEAIRMCITNPLSMITGGPGRGKTHCIALFIKYILENLEKCKVVCVAVAGTAANQLNLSLRKANVCLPGVEIGTFAKKIEFNTIKSEEFENYVFIVDETSMVNQHQINTLLKKIKRIGFHKCKVVLMGDEEQLPSIGLGNILKDLIDSKKVSNKKLTKIHRTESKNLIKLLDDIKNKKFDLMKAAELKKDLKKINDKTINIYHDKETGNRFCKNKMINKLKKILKQNNINPKNTIFISPENGPKFANEGIPDSYKTKSYPFSVYHLNILLREYFNPLGKIDSDGYHTRKIPNSNTGIKPEGYVRTVGYRTGDRIQYNTNEYNEGEPDIYRGMLGTIVDFKKTPQDKTVVYIKFDDIPSPYRKEITLEELNGDDVNLGYAMTIHKAQGITKDNVFMFAMNNHSFSLRNNGRPLAYVGCSRAKYKLFLFTNGLTLDTFKLDNPRRTGLFKNYERIE